MVPTSIATVMYLMTVLFACVLGIGVGGPHVLDPTATLGSENGGNRQPTRFDRPGHLGARGIGARQRPWRSRVPSGVGSNSFGSQYRGEATRAPRASFLGERV
jgi:hypothetical protein